MTNPHKRRVAENSDQGFTLLELLVALLVLGIVMSGLTQASRLNLQLSDRITTAVRQLSEREAADRTLRNLIEQMESGPSPSSAPDWQEAQGTSSTLQFITTLPECSDALPNNRVQVRLEVDGRHRLILRWLPYPHVGRPPQPASHQNTATTTVLLEDVGHLLISYWPSNTASLRWQTAWQPQTPLLLVRIRLVFDADHPGYWPDVIAAPRHTSTPS